MTEDLRTATYPRRRRTNADLYVTRQARPLLATQS